MTVIMCEIILYAETNSSVTKTNCDFVNKVKIIYWKINVLEIKLDGNIIIFRKHNKNYLIQEIQLL